MNKLKLSNLSFSLVIITLLNSTSLGILFPFLIKSAKTSVFTSLLISYFIGFVMLYIYFKIFNFLPSKNIFEKIDEVFPKFISKLLFLIISILVFLFCMIIFYRLTTFISTEFLVDTPTIFIAIVLCIPIAYLLIFDFDVLARIATISVFGGLVLSILNFVFLSKDMDFNNLKPILNNDFIHLAKSSVVFTITYFGPLFLTLVIPKESIIDNHKTKKSVFIAYSFSILFISLIFYAVLSILGVDVSLIYTYPSYVVLKNISVLNFIQNIENVGIIVFLLFMTVCISFCLLFLKKLILHNFNITLRKANIYAFALFIPLISLILFSLPYENYINKLELSYILGLILFILSFIFFITFVVGKIKNK